MKRNFLVAGGLAVAGLLIALIFMSRTSSSEPTSKHAPADTPSTSETPHMRAPLSMPAISTQVAVPAVPGGAPTSAFILPDGGMRIVHDHTHDGPRGAPSPINSDSVVAMRKAMIDPIRTCAETAALDPDHIIQISIQATVTSAGGRESLSNAKILGAANTPLTQPIQDCIVQAMNSVQFDSPDGQADFQHDILQPFKLP
jgi:hypothetical protein